MSWIPLHVHSQYSILDSTASTKALVQKAVDYQIKSLALTDSGNMFGVIEFYKAAMEKNIKPIIGCMLRMSPHARHEKKKIYGMPTSFPFVVLAMNNVGYQNLCRLSSIGYLEGFYYHPRVDKEVLEKYSEGLICLSGSYYSNIGYLATQDKNDELLEEILWYQQVFGDRFYFELQNYDMSAEDIAEDSMEEESWVLQKLQAVCQKQKLLTEKLLDLSQRLQIPYVATNEIHYIERLDWKAHEILLNVQSGEPREIWEKDSEGRPKARILNPKRKVYASHEHYFKSPEQIEKIFSAYPMAIENSIQIADRCLIEIDFKTKHYPVFSLPGQTQTPDLAANFLKDLCNEGIEKKYTKEKLDEVLKIYPEKDPLEVVKQRLEYELSIIISKGMCDYILIVYDFISWSKQRKIPMGPGRGSAAGSIIAYLIGITDIEPLRFGLFFERFINPERVSYPDIDVDICMERRQEVIDYTVNKYGKEKVAQIITFGKMKAKMAIKDVGRVLSVPLSKVNEIAKLVPEDVNMTLDKAFEIDPDMQRFYENDKEAKILIDMARKTEGSIRNTGIHAAGLIVSKDALTDHIPVCSAKDTDMVVTQYAMKPVEAVGMLKIDFLGLKTLTSIQIAVDAAYKTTGVKIDWCNLPLDDRPTFSLLNQGKTLGVFQLESTGMQELARKLHIDHFEEIIAVGALYRPGPMDMIPSFISRKHGTEKIEFDHPLMKDILQETYGVMVYQEQVMMIASKLAGYSLGEGDVLRRAMGKKDHDEMANQRKKFLQGAKDKGIEESVAGTVFDKIEKFASYGFNKSHAAAYGYLSYTTAYLKANYPKEWMAALMTCDRDDLTKVAKFIRECQALSIEVLPPDVNESGVEFTATEKGIRFAMTGIKGVGEASVEATIGQREQNGPYASLYDFIKRVDKKRVAKKNIENMILAGCFDFTDWSKDALVLSLEGMYETASRDQKEKDQGIMNLFSLMGEQEDDHFQIPPKVLIPMNELELLQKEKELLGFYLTGHPMKSYAKQIKALSCHPFKEVVHKEHDTVCRAAFIVEDVQIRISSKTQKKFAILTVGDGLDRFELPIWPELFETTSHFLAENRLLYGVIQVNKKDQNLRLQCHYLDDLTQVDEEKIKNFDNVYDRAKYRRKAKMYKKNPAVEKKKVFKMLSLKLDADNIKFSHVLMLKKVLRENRGDIPVDLFFFSNTKLVGQIHIASSWGVDWQQELQGQLKEVPYLMACNIQ